MPPSNHGRSTFWDRIRSWEPWAQRYRSQTRTLSVLSVLGPALVMIWSWEGKDGQDDVFKALRRAVAGVVSRRKEDEEEEGGDQGSSRSLVRATGWISDGHDDDGDVNSLAVMSRGSCSSLDRTSCVNIATRCLRWMGRRKMMWKGGKRHLQMMKC